MHVAINAHGFSHMITMFDFVYTYGDGRTTTDIPQQALNTYEVIIQLGHARIQIIFTAIPTSFHRGHQYTHNKSS